MTHTCPVCGYNDLADPPTNFNICPSCGTEFGFDDDAVSHEELRQRWIASGAKWWSNYDECPLFWSPIDQLENVNYRVTDADKISIAPTDQAIAGAFALLAPYTGVLASPTDSSVSRIPFVPNSNIRVNLLSMPSAQNYEVARQRA